MSIRPVGTLAVMVLLLGAVVAPGAAGAAPCEDDPTYADGVTSPQSAIVGWPHRRALTTDLNDYVLAIDEESDRVVTEQFGESNGGTPLYYSLVGTPENLAAVDEIAAAQKSLRDPRITSEEEAAEIAAENPAIVWYIGNTHGNETSGADSSLTILYDLAARTDCHVEQILDNLVVGVITTQNPDGRDVYRRTNNFDFDLNRDWFRVSQKETPGKLDVLLKYPPVMIIDAHEMGNDGFFFPPFADPAFHEVSSQELHWINDFFAPAITEEFESRAATEPTNWNYFNYATYDLFCMCRMTPFMAAGFTAAGLVYEKGVADTDNQRYIEHVVAGWATIEQSALHKEEILTQYHEAFSDAIEAGAKGELEPNEVIAPDAEVANHIPADLSVRHYFLGRERAIADVDRLVGRLMNMGVEVHRLDKDLKVDELGSYGFGTEEGTVPEGSYWIPMEQPQKRYIQAVLHEQPYPAVFEFYDVTSWSNPLLTNVDGWFTADELKPKATEVLEAPTGGVEDDPDAGGSYWFEGDTGWAVAGALSLARAGAPVVRVPASDDGVPAGAFVVPAEGTAEAVHAAADEFDLTIHASDDVPTEGVAFEQPKIAVFSSLAGGESQGHQRYLLQQAWKLPHTELTVADVLTGALESGGYDVLLVGGGNTTELRPAADRIQSWIEAGGIYVGTARPGGSGGTPYAVQNGFTSSTLSSAPDLDVPGTQFRIGLEQGSPVTLGAPEWAYLYNLGEQVLSTSTTGIDAGLYPAEEPAFWFSGYADGTEPLMGSAAVVDEALGDGRVVLFSGEMNFRAWTDGTAFLLANALTYPMELAPAATDVTSAAAAEDVLRAMRSAGPVTGPGRPIRVRVPADHVTTALAVVERFTDDAQVLGEGPTRVIQIPDPADLDAEEQHPFARTLVPTLRAAGVEVISAIL
jgi:Zinc carboxypeptidase